MTENMVTGKGILHEFRLSHPYKELTVNRNCWEYISCGKGTRTILLIHTGFVNAEMFTPQIQALETDYRIIAPNIPPTVSTMEEICVGLAKILQVEGVSKATVLGDCSGGAIAQCFVRRYPNLIEYLILSNTHYPHKESMYAKRGLSSPRSIRFVPTFLIRKLIQKQITKYLSPDLNAEPSAWEWASEYAKELPTKVTRRLAASQMNIMYDFMRNYEFNAGDLQHWEGKILILGSEDESQTELEELKQLYPDAKSRVFEARGLMGLSTMYATVIRQFVEEE